MSASTATKEGMMYSTDRHIGKLSGAESPPKNHMHFLAFLRSLGAMMMEEGVLEAGSVYLYALKDPFFPPLSPRDYPKVFEAHFNGYKLGPKTRALLMTSFAEAVDLYDPPLIKKASHV